MAKVTLYGTFRRYVDAWTCEIDAPTVGAALNALTADNPRLRSAVFADSDADRHCAELRPYVRIVVNGRDVALGDCLGTALKAGDEVAVFSPIAGG